MKKALILFLTLTIILTSFVTVSFAASDFVAGLEVKSLKEQITEGNQFNVIFCVDTPTPHIFSYQVGIDYDETYFRLDNITSSVKTGYEGIEVIDNTYGEADYAYYVGNATIAENNNDGYYPLAVLTFTARKDVDETTIMSIDAERTMFLDADGNEIDHSLDDLIITIPSAPYKTSPTASNFFTGTKLVLETATKDADIYYTDRSEVIPNKLYSGKITLPNQSITYYAVARKYGISSEVSTIKMTFRGLNPAAGMGTGTGTGTKPGGVVVTPAPSTKPSTTPSTNTNPTPAPTPEKYADIKGHWAETHIKKLIDKKIINGYEDGTVKPGNTVTRAEIAKIIVCALGQGEAADKTLGFADSAEIADWAKGYIKTAVNLGILNGYEDNTFRASQPVTRQELAKIAMLAFKYGESEKALTFADANTIPGWAAKYVAAAVENGIITGYEDNTFKPAGQVTRAEACTIISKCLK